MQEFILVFLGGGIGSCARYWLQGVVYRFVGAGFPSGTVIVNVLGSLVIGLLSALFESRFLLNPSLRIFLTIGILGGFTTFSSFSYETVQLLRDSEYFLAGMNIGLNVVLCLFATYAGTVAGKLL